ncbi:hypothetical protein [Chitinophaga nivalis]|uniref:Uncharacterized protein n=1 Tax=Chitinophaga nivalis TaxID=2991709 RepID=A0ABT3IS31_9BACT|nr:hypothetical protein [Chitinophaga nivalis]MCW3463547.1 hypothetical protein [Chitinophaga nivalis]MCW3486763.1 hypothetical protein [Chitinophaga nivalis]
MRKSLRIAVRVALLGGVGLVASQANAQLKVGNNPTVIEKSAILELESVKQGLLLPRLTDFTAINALTPPDGMIVYLNSADATQKGLYVRRNGAWVMIASAADAAANWSLKGNTPAAGDFLGTTNNSALVFKTDNQERFQITGAGQLKTAAGTIPDGTNEVEILVINPTDGVIRKRTVKANAFGDLVNSINDVNGPILFDVTGSKTTLALNVDNDKVNKKISVNVPIMDNVNQAFGFLSQADWKKIQTMSSADGITVATLITAAAGDNLDKGAKITFDATTSKYKLEMIAADATHAGIVTTTTQSFGGNKTFEGTLDVKEKTTLAKGLEVTTGSTLFGADATVKGLFKLETINVTADAPKYDVLISKAGIIEKKELSDAAFKGAIQKLTATGSTKELKGPDVNFATGTTGNNFNIELDDAAAANKITFNLPDADATAGAEKRGVVSTTAQSFAGNKNFKDNVAVGKLTASTSTLDISGSVAMSIRKVDAGTTAITDKDNTLLVPGDLTVTLPKASDVPGRIYTIKKISGDIEKPVKVTSGGGAIEGANNGYTIYNDWTFITLQSDGTDWYIIRK